MSYFRQKFLLPALLVGLTRAVFACDACALYLPSGETNPGYALAIAGQFTRLGTTWAGDRRQPNPVEQYLESSITQFTVSYSRGGRWHGQLTVPYIQRSYLRPNHALVETGRESGWGDATLAMRYEAWRRETAGGGWMLGLVGGVKFATGDASRLGDAVGHHHHHHANFPDSGVHGHDLALGSGSTDWLIGADAEWWHARFFSGGGLQYKLRRPGAFDYRLADEVSWEAGPGWQVVLAQDRSLRVQALFSAEHRSLDTLAGVAQVDTGFSAHYLGLRLAGTWRRHFSAEASVEKPVRIRTSELQVVPDYRLRAAATWRF